MITAFIVTAVTMLVMATLIVGHAALENHGRLLRAQARAQQAELVGDQRGHEGAIREIAFLRPAVLRARLASALSGVLTVAAIIYTTARIR